MKTLIDEQLYQSHINGDCEEGCVYCEMNEELNSAYDFIEQRKGKVASFSKNEKALKKQ